MNMWLHRSVSCPRSAVLWRLFFVSAVLFHLQQRLGEYLAFLAGSHLNSPASDLWFRRLVCYGHDAGGEGV